MHNKARRPVATRIRGGGSFGFGLLDPTSNIIANTFMIPCPRDPTAEKGRGDEAAACGVKKEEELKGAGEPVAGRHVTFLTRFFPYLADCEAVCYLLLADADLLIATRFIVVDRRMKRFGSSGPAVEEALRMALRCAALAAQHPDPDRFVGAWLTISSRLDEAVGLLAKVRRRSPSSSLRNLEKLLHGPQPQVDDCRGTLLLAWQLAMSRRPLPRIVPYQNTSTGLKRVLLDAIHGFYLQALARLPPASCAPATSAACSWLVTAMAGWPTQPSFQHHCQHHMVRRSVPTRHGTRAGHGRQHTRPPPDCDSLHVWPRLLPLHPLPSPQFPPSHALPARG